MKRSKKAEAAATSAIPDEVPGSNGAWYELSYFIGEGGVILSPGTPRIVGLRCKYCQTVIHPEFGITSGVVYVRGHNLRNGTFVPPYICDDCAFEGLK